MPHPLRTPGLPLSLFLVPMVQGNGSKPGFNGLD